MSKQLFASMIVFRSTKKQKLLMRTRSKLNTATMSLSEEELQQYIGRSFQEAKQELEGLGYVVQDVRHGSRATGLVLPKEVQLGAEAANKKRAILSYNGDDPDEKVTHIRQD